MDSIIKILPIFIVTALGFLGKRLGFLPDSFQVPANRLVYYFAIPCLIFLKVVHASFGETLDAAWIVYSVAAIVVGWLFSIFISGVLRLKGGTRGTFIQASIHANLGYIGLAAAYYGLGESGVRAASLFAPFYMIANNGLVVITMNHLGDSTNHTPAGLLKALIVHPIILAAFAGMLWSMTGVALPVVVGESMGIMAGMALPLALLLIGAGLNTEALGRAKLAGASTLIKNMVIPFAAMVALRLAGADGVELAAAVLLLSAPSATITMILANEMGGDPPLASSAVTLSTLVSIGTLTFWLWLLG